MEEWELLTIKISARENPLVASVSPKEIVVLGGLLGHKNFPGDGYVIDTERLKVTRLEQRNSLQFISWSNSCAVVAPG